MSDVERLLAAFDAGDLLRPSPDVPGVVDLGNAIASLMGANGVRLDPNARRIADLIGPAEHLVLVAADGLGMDAVRALGDEAFLPSHVGMELQTVFPTSTPVVFTSLATGQWPNRHAVTGWHTYLSESDCVSTIIHFSRRSDEKGLSELGISARQAYPVPSALGRFKRDSLSLLPEDIADTTYSTYVAGGTPQRGYATLHGAIDAVLARVSGARSPTFTYVYTPAIDAVAHMQGAGHEKTRAMVHQLDAEMKRLVTGLPQGCVVALTADHGLLDADEAQTHRIEPSEELLKCVVGEPWGDKRAVNFEVLAGSESRFERLFRERLGDSFYLITVDEAARLELYGPGELSPVARRRLGKYIALSTGPDILKYPFATKNEEHRMVSHHSGLTSSEMLVPLVVAET